MKKIIALVSMCALIFAVPGCGKEPVQANVENTGKVEQKQVVEAFGIAKSTDIRNINIDFAAVVSKINVIEGQRVKEGDVLLSLNTQNYQTQIKNKEFELNTLKIQLDGLKRDYEVKQKSLNENSDPDIKKYMSDISYAQALYSKGLEDLNSNQALYKSGAVSKNVLDECQKTVDEKKQAADNAQMSLNSLIWKMQRELETLKTSIDEKNSQADSLIHDINNMKEKLNKDCIKGNDVISDVHNGVVSEIACVQGDIVVATEEGKKILSVINTDTMIIEADVAEEFIKDVKIGSEVSISPQADKSHSYKGRVLSISEKAVLKNNETIIPVRISIENKDNFLLPEFNVDVKINTL